MISSFFSVFCQYLNYLLNFLTNTFGDNQTTQAVSSHSLDLSCSHPWSSDPVSLMRNTVFLLAELWELSLRAWKNGRSLSLALALSLSPSSLQPTRTFLTFSSLNASLQPQSHILQTGCYCRTGRGRDCPAHLHHLRPDHTHCLTLPCDSVPFSPTQPAAYMYTPLIFNEQSC